MRNLALLAGLIVAACTRAEPRADSATTAETLMAAPDSTGVPMANAPASAPATPVRAGTTPVVGMPVPMTAGMPPSAPTAMPQRIPSPTKSGNLLYDSTYAHDSAAKAREPRMSRPPVQTP